MCPSARSLLCAASLVSTLVAAPAHATYSLLIADTATGLIGSVGASCVGRQAVSVISGVAPGFGAIHAQAQSNASGRDRGVMMLAAGATADETVSAITAPNFDRAAASRQYGVVTLLGTAAGYTGSANMAYAEDRQATFGSYVSSFQGNILTSADVLEQLADSLQTKRGCDLPDTLMLALEAGAQNDQGDSRCTPGGIAADSGFLKVVDREGKLLISIEVTGRSTDGAVAGLREQFDAWRTTHACAKATDAGTRADGGIVNASEDAGGQAELDARVPAPDATTRDAQGGLPSSDASSTGTRTSDAGEGGDRVRDAGTRDASRRDASAPDTQTADETPDREAARDGGCSVAPTSDPGWLLGLGLMLALRRRRAPTRT